MKKIVFLIVTMATLCGAAAQDTVYWDSFNMGNYYVYGNIPRSNEITSVGNLIAPSLGGEIGKYFFSSDTLTIYGIAASIREYTGGYYLDTSCEQSFEYLRLYDPGRDSLQCINQTTVYLHRNISYYVVFDTIYPPSVDIRFAEMHERYFITPTTVVDSFYVGTTYFLFVPNDEGDYHYDTPPMFVNSLNGLKVGNDEDFLFSSYRQDGSHAWHRRHMSNRFTVIFPILTPPPYVGRDTTTHVGDTTIIGDTVIVTDTTIVSDTLVINGDTIINYDTIVTYDTILGIDDHGLLGRLTGVMPNPAAETAKVVSSFGMSRVEVYNLAGERVHEQRVPDGSLSATLDLRRLPAGAYLLRIHTPQGIASKKLTVRR